MSVVIDGIRGAFRNMGEKQGARGLYPFEEIKQIYDIVSELGFRVLTEDQKNNARTEIIRLWGRVQEPFLSEFDRAVPSFPSSPYVMVSNLQHLRTGTNGASEVDQDYPRIRILSAIVNPSEGDVEAITLRNYESHSIDLSGWVIRDKGDHTQLLNGSIDPNATLTFCPSALLLSIRGGSIALFSQANVCVDRVEYNQEDAREIGKTISFREN